MKCFRLVPYDQLGRIASRDINGATQSIAYDALGRVTGVTNVLGAFAYAYVGTRATDSTPTILNRYG